MTLKPLIDARVVDFGTKLLIGEQATMIDVREWLIWSFSSCWEMCEVVVDENSPFAFSLVFRLSVFVLPFGSSHCCASFYCFAHTTEV